IKKDAVEDKKDPGRVEVLEGARDLYLSFLMKTLPDDFNLRDMKIVLDCANGAAFGVAPALFERLGAGVTAMNTEPNGKNINLECGSQHTETLSRRVIEAGAELGLAFDGDGDRLIAVDEKGQTLTGDQLLTIYAKMLRDGDALKQNIVVSTIMSNMGFRLALKDLGIEQAAAKVGDRFVMEEMREREAVLGGEDSGHIIFMDYHTTGDGLISALQIVRALRTFHRPLSELAGLMTVFPQVLMNVPVSRKGDISRVPAVAGEIARVESALGERGRVLVRFSGTEPVCRVMVEGEDRREIEGYAGRIADKIKQALGGH
ncbi:MAG: phosphoglucosamine mutase, partial [Pseudomonadota bacterium]